MERAVVWLGSGNGVPHKHISTQLHQIYRGTKFEVTVTITLAKSRQNEKVTATYADKISHSQIYSSSFNRGMMRKWIKKRC